MARMSCEEWFSKLLDSLSGERRQFVGDQVPGRKGVKSAATAQLVTVEAFHREYLRVVTLLNGLHNVS